jgi:hypothetical protein
MAMMHARVCGDCEREVPSWAERCLSCGSLSIGHRIVIVPPATPVTALAEARHARTKVRRRVIAGGHEPTSPQRSTA